MGIRMCIKLSSVCDALSCRIAGNLDRRPRRLGIVTATTASDGRSPCANGSGPLRTERRGKGGGGRTRSREGEKV